MSFSYFEADGIIQNQSQSQGQSQEGAAEALPLWQEEGEKSDHREQIRHYHTMNCPQYARGVCPRAESGCFCYHFPSEKRRPLVDTLSGKLKYWDIMCEFVDRGEDCPFGDDCVWAHTNEEVLYHAAKYKTKLCTDRNSTSQKFSYLAHGEDELRTTAPEKYSYWRLVGGISHGIQGVEWNPDMSTYDPAILAAAGPHAVAGAAGYDINSVMEPGCDQVSATGGNWLYPQQVYKLRFCASYPNVSSCRRGDSCAFAHSREDIRLPLLEEDEEEQQPTALTNDFFMYRFKTLWCPVGVQHDWQTCVYAHNYQDARRHPRVGYGPRPCPYWKRQETSLEYSQRCPLGVRCPFSHGAKEQLYHPAYFKTVTCQDSPSGACPRGKLCAFWHKRSQQRARPSTRGLQDEFNYKFPIPEQRMQESLQPDFLTPPFKLLNAVQQQMQAMSWGGTQDWQMGMCQMSDGTQGWMCPSYDARTPVTQTTGIDSDEAASSLSGSDKQTGGRENADGQAAGAGMAMDCAVPWGACGQHWSSTNMWGAEGSFGGYGPQMPYGSCGGGCNMGGAMMLMVMPSMGEQGMQMDAAGGQMMHMQQSQDTSSADVLLAELGGLPNKGISTDEAADGTPQGEAAQPQMMYCMAMPVVQDLEPQMGTFAQQ